MAFKVGGTTIIDNSGNVSANVGNIDGRDIAADGTKLDGIESGATADQNASEIKTSYESNSDTNAYTDAEKTKLSGIETGATADQSASEILTAVKTVDGTGSGLDADLWDGNQFSSYLNQSVKTDASPTFSNAYIAGSIYHSGDTNTRLLFETDTVTLQTGGSSEITVNTTGVRLGDTGNGYFRPVSGNYGSIEIDGGAHTTYEGYSIGGRAVFMHNNSTTTGIYNDVENEWLFKATHNGASEMYDNGVVKGYTYSSGFRVTGNLLASANVYAYYSDERLKAKDGVIEDALGMIGSLDTFYYYENEKAKELGHDNDRRQIGVSAQQVEAIMPEAVAPAPFDLESDNEGNKWSKSGDDYLTVDYPRLVPLLIKGIQELEARVQELENGSSN